MKSTSILVSLVVPAFNEEQIIDAFLRLLIAEFGEVAGFGVEVVVVNDGSTDQTARIVREVAMREPRIRMLSFTQNMGQQRALVAGMEHARGDAVVTMDADGQHPPAKAREMIEMWLKNPSVHVIQGVRKGSQGGAGKDWSSSCFYRLMRLLAPECSIVAGMSDFRLLDRAALDLIRQYSDRHRNLRLLVGSLPMPVTFAEYELEPRLGGHSKFTLDKMIRLAMDGLFAYSNLPLRLSLLGSCVTGIAAFFFLIYAVTMKWRGATAWGWASLMSVTIGLFSVVFGVLAVISEYVARIYEDVRAKPIYWVDPATSHGFDARTTPDSMEKNA